MSLTYTFSVVEMFVKGITFETLWVFVRVTAYKMHIYLIKLIVITMSLDVTFVV